MNLTIAIMHGMIISQNDKLTHFGGAVLTLFLKKEQPQQFNSKLFFGNFF